MRTSQLISLITAVLLAATPVSSDVIDDFVANNAICTIMPGSGGLPAGGDLLRSTVVASPQPLCNDGTPPIMYVGRGDGGGGAASPNWVIHLQGGGACTDFDSCLGRWCNSSPPLDAGKMSSAFAHDGIQGGGIFSQNPLFQNPFQNWNHVFLYYCSSDSWVGASQGTSLLVEESPGSRSYEVYFEGHDILKAAIDTLIVGAQPDNLAFTLPSLASAERVILSGDSAGSTGARQHADRVREWIAAVHADPLDLDFRLLADAAMVPAPERLGEAEWELQVKPVWDEAWVTAWSAIPDASCIASKGGIASTEAWKCGDPSHVIAHHVSVPFFTRQDLADPVKPKNSFEDFIGAVSLQLGSWAGYPAIMPPYATDSIEGVSPSQGVFGPNCGTHVGIRNDEAFFGQTIDEPSVGLLSYADVLTNWLTGTGPRFVIEEVTVDAQGLATSVTPSSGPGCTPLVLSQPVPALPWAASGLLLAALGACGFRLARRQARD